jgi:hypothetical protein
MEPVTVLSGMLGLLVGVFLWALAWPFIERGLNWWYDRFGER